jgi:amidase
MLFLMRKQDGFKYPGVDSTLGYVSLVGKTATVASSLVKLLLDLGAVLYVKTNVPQTLMVWKSSFDQNAFIRLKTMSDRRF